MPYNIIYLYKLAQISAEVSNKVPKSYRTFFAVADSSQATWWNHSSASREFETELPGVLHLQHIMQKFQTVIDLEVIPICDITEAGL